MTIKLGIIMDPLESIKPHKDTSFALLLAAQKRNYKNYYISRNSLTLKNNDLYATLHEVEVTDNNDHYYQIKSTQFSKLSHLDMVLVRKDPPFDINYVFDTYLLEFAKKSGMLIFNDPTSLRDLNEKLATLLFPECCPKTIVTRDFGQIKAFIEKHGNTIIKPLDGMGGTSIFHIRNSDDNLNVIIETVSNMGTQPVMVQQYIEEITQGDKRILLIDGEPIPYALARIPSEHDFRGNLAKGGTGKGVKLTERDYWICNQVGEELKKRGVIFAGLDVIGDYLTEINVTSPTCVRELDKLYNLDIASFLFDKIEERYLS